MNVDGASRGNPGPAAIGVTLKDEKRNLVAAISQRIGITTNNQAEYTALISALKQAAKLGAQHVKVNSDSELMVRQLQGKYRVKSPDLRPLYEEAVRLARSFKTFQVASIPREQNREADKLANAAFDEV